MGYIIEHMVNTIQIGVTVEKKQNVHACYTISFSQAQYTVPLREQLATGNGKWEE